MPDTIFVLNGPNLNLLGEREPEIYGAQTLGDIQRKLEMEAAKHDFVIDFRQSNSEGDLVDWIQEAQSHAQGLIINAGAYTHTSIAIYDALKFTKIPCIEVHLSNIFQREPFRHHSYVSPNADGVLCGFGAQGYEFALGALRQKINVQ